jgi:thiol-disulfide isomerase/thioredoxin
MKNLLILLLVLNSINIIAQPLAKNRSDLPVIGKPCPDFTFYHIEHFSRKYAHLKDFKGKWLILDLWIKHCSACIASFPQTDTLQRKFKDKVQFFLLGIPTNDDAGSIRQVYERSRTHYDLSLPIAYDPSFAERFGASSFPHIIWIDDTGIVRAVTGSIHEKDLQEFLTGGHPDPGKKRNDKEIMNEKNQFDLRKPFLINHNGGEDTDFYIRSVLTGWQKSVLHPGSIEGTAPLGFFEPNTILATNSPVSRLYETAYGDTIAWYLPGNPNYGKWWTNGPILELRDPSQFSFNFDKGQNLYCYALMVPSSKASKKKMQEIMQADLKNYFGYEVRVEKRIMPYWKLLATEKTKFALKTKRGTPVRDASKAEIVLKNQPVSSLLELIWSFNQKEPLFVNETGITDNIDLTLNCVFTDFEDLKKELQKKGLILEKGEKEMNVIVISDQKN